MNKLTRLGAIGAVLVFGLMQAAHATMVSYDVINISGTTWEYTYNIANDTLAQDIEEFTVFYDVSLFQNLAAGSVALGWDPLVVQPDLGLSDDGFYDALALGSGLSSGDSLSGFSVVFEYLGSGTPGAQNFTIIDPNTFITLDSGVTQVSAVPIPAALWLFGCGILSLFGLGSRRLCNHP